MKKRRIAIFLFLIGFSVFSRSPALADGVDRLYDKAAEKFHKLYKDTPFKDNANNWLRTIKQFMLVHQNYPDHVRAPDALFNIGRLYRSLFQANKKEIYLDRSSIAFRKLVARYPESALADDAQFLLAENYELFKNDQYIALFEYEKLLKQYPDRSRAAKARKKLKHLRPQYKEPEITPDTNRTMLPANLTEDRYGGVDDRGNLNERPLVPVSRVQYWSTEDWFRMVVNTKTAVRYKSAVLSEDESHRFKRLYIDILHSILPIKKREIPRREGLIIQARIAQFDEETVRIALDLTGLSEYTIWNFKLPNQNKIVIEGTSVRGKLETRAGSATARRLQSGPPLKKRPKPTIGTNDQMEPYVSLSTALALKTKRIILDPGHGGKDPGAMAFGLKEKDIALRIALSLRRIIRQNHPKVKVFMTRSTDKYVGLEARTAFANENRGDLFISIHLNASSRPSLKGMETYYLHLTDDDYALNLAAKENQLTRKSVSDLQIILNELMNNSKIRESIELANMVQASVVKTSQASRHELYNLGVKRAPFIVLVGARMPSVLIEAGFLTHLDENNFLKTPKYRKLLAEGIYRGISRYIN